MNYAEAMENFNNNMLNEYLEKDEEYVEPYDNIEFTQEEVERLLDDMSTVYDEEEGDNEYVDRVRLAIIMELEKSAIRMRKKSA